MSFEKEKHYIVNYLMNTVLGLGVKIENSYYDTRYQFLFGGKILEFKDDFFSRFENESVPYICAENIPTKLFWFNASVGENKRIPMIYGEDVLICKRNYIYCGLDIFASSFFMLTRWEESVIPKKDRFGRCEESELFVVRHGIYDRPIVNEYIELIRSLLLHLEIPLPNIDRHFTVYLTHDIDDLFRFASLNNFCRNIAGDILHRKSVLTLIRTLKRYFLFRLGRIKDPFDTFDDLMDMSDHHGFKNAFYFKASFSDEYDATYDIQDIRVKKIIDNILIRGHEVGFHPSKNTFHNPKQFEAELQRLKELYPNIKGGRQHFLLYDIPFSLRVWNDVGLQYDAGLGFAFRAGFRCGICYEYPFFDVYEREQKELVIRPLIVMEGTLFANSEYQTLQSIEDCMKRLAEIVCIYKGDYVFLWHNDNFNRPETSRYGYIYNRIVKHLGSLCANVENGCVDVDKN